MITVYDNDIMEKALRDKKVPAGIYININTDLAGAKRTERKGLDISLNEQKSNRGALQVLYSFESPGELFKDKRFMTAMSYSNIHFFRLPFHLDEIADATQIPTHESPALRVAAQNLEMSDLLRILQHDYRNRPEETIERAFQLKDFLNTYSVDTEEGLTALFTNYVDNYPKKKGQGELPGVFVDIEGTLVVNESINPAVIERIMEYSADHPIILWTGGDVGALTRQYRPLFSQAVSEYADRNNAKTNLHLRTPILSKHAFNGYTPQIVLDDLPQKEFTQRYGMNPREYIQTTS